MMFGTATPKLRLRLSNPNHHPSTLTMKPEMNELLSVLADGSFVASSRALVDN